jgi:hypothetical protein
VAISNGPIAASAEAAVAEASTSYHFSSAAMEALE